MPSAEIFISYSRANLNIVDQVYERLREKGYDLWLDLRKLEPGEKWWPQIQEAIDRCDSVVLCLSVESLGSVWVEKEWKYARLKGKRVIPAMVDEVFKHPRITDKDSKIKIPRWIDKGHCLDLREDGLKSDLAWERLFETLNTPYEPRRNPMMIPLLPEQYIDRPQEKEPIVAALLNTDKPAVALTTALKGAGGYGKTTLACAIARDERISDMYYDGQLFVTLGESLTESALIAKVRDLIRELTGKEPALADANAARVALNDAIGDRNILLVVDDVWDAAHLAPFLVEGPRCAKLITTRNERLLSAAAQIYLIDQMRPQEALALLTWGLPEAPRTLNPRLTALADRLGRWAQVLKMVNGVLRQQTAQGQTLAGALDYVGEGLTEEGLEAFDDPSSTNQRHRTARAALAVSLRQLKDDADRAAFAQLAIFPEDADVPLAVLEKLWGRSAFKTRALCDTFFAGLALLQEYNAGAGTLRLHDVIRTDLRVQHKESLVDWNTALLAALGDPYSLPNPYAWRFYAYHLLEAGQTDRLRALLLDYRWLRAKLVALDAAALVADCDTWLNAQTAASLETREPIRLLRSALTNSEHVLAEDKEALAHQLVGRLMLHRRQHPEIRALTDAAQETGGFRLVNPDSEYPALNPAGGHLLRTLAGHANMLVGVIELADEHILSCSEDHTLNLWSADGLLLTSIKGPSSPINGIAQLTENRIVSWSNENMICIWMYHGKSLSISRTLNYSASDLRVISGGRFITWIDRISSLQNKPQPEEEIFHLWASDGTLIAKLEGHQCYVRDVLELSNRTIVTWAHTVPFGPYDDYITYNQTLLLWSEKGELLSNFGYHSDDVSSAVELSNGNLLTCSYSGDAIIWLQKQPSNIVVKEQLHSVTSLSNGNFIGWSYNKIHMYGSDGTKLLSIQEDFRDGIRGVHVFDNGNILCWSLSGDLHLWTSPKSRLLLSNNVIKARDVYCVSGQFAVSVSSRNSNLVIWNSNGTRVYDFKGHTEQVLDAIFLSSGRILSWSLDRTLRLWNFHSGEEIANSQTKHQARVNGLQRLPGDRFLSWSEDATLCIWNIKGEILHVLAGHEKSISGTLLLSDNRILSWSEDSTIRIWNLKGECLAVLKGHVNQIHGAIEQRDGKLVSWSEDFTIRIWSQDYKLEETLPGRWMHGVNVLLWRADKRSILVRNGNNIEILSENNKLLAVMKGHTSPVTKVIELSNGDMVSWASESDSTDFVPNLWSSNGTLISSLEGHTNRIIGVIQISHQRLLSWSSDKTIRLWSQDGTPLATLNAIEFDAQSQIWAEEHRFEISQVSEIVKQMTVADSSHVFVVRNIIMRKTGNGSIERSFIGDAHITALAFSCNHAQLVAGDEDGRVIFCGFQ